jgi:hypothetical protein
LTRILLISKHKITKNVQWKYRKVPLKTRLDSTKLPEKTAALVNVTAYLDIYIELICIYMDLESNDIFIKNVIHMDSLKRYDRINYKDFSIITK